MVFGIHERLLLAVLLSLFSRVVGAFNSATFKRFYVASLVEMSGQIICQTPSSSLRWKVGSVNEVIKVS